MGFEGMMKELNLCFPRAAVLTAVWAVLPAFGSLFFRLAFGTPVGGSWSFAEATLQLPGWIGLFLPFAAFAGGLAAGEKSRRKCLGVVGIASAVLAYILLAFVSPSVQPIPPAVAALEAETGLKIAPSIPPNLVARRAAVREDPPEQFSFSIDRPLERPPNWLTFLIHNPAVLAIFAILAVFLGQQVGFLTSGLSPPWRQNTRWGIGLLTSIAFFVAVMVGEDWVRADPSHSGILGAWVPLLVPLVELAFLAPSVRRSRNRLHVPAHPVS